MLTQVCVIEFSDITNHMIDGWAGAYAKEGVLNLKLCFQGHISAQQNTHREFRDEFHNSSKEILRR